MSASALATKIGNLQRAAKRDRVELPFTDGEVFKVTWLAPDAKTFAKFDELDDVKDELRAWMPVGKADGRCIMAKVEAPHAVAVFDDGFQPLAPSLDAFFGTKLLAKGEKSPLKKLEDAVEKADAKLEAGKAKQALELLKEALAPYQTMPDPKRENVEDNEDALGRGFCLMGVAAHECGDDDLALRAYTFGQAFLEFSCGRNIMILHTDHGRYAEAIAFATNILAEWERKISIEDELEIRGRMLAVHWLQGDAKTAEKKTSEWLARAKATKKERKMLLDVVADALDGKAPDALQAAKRLLA